MDADLAKAIAQVLGLKVKVKNATFDAIIPGLADGRYDLGMSSFTDTKEREKTVNFVTYFSAGTSFYDEGLRRPDRSPTWPSLCGLKVAVESGTTQEADVKAQSKKCTGGKTVKVLVLHRPRARPTSHSAPAAAQVGMADSPVAAYQVKQSGRRVQAGRHAVRHRALRHRDPEAGRHLDQAVLAAVKDLIANGTYTQILTKWGIQSGAITNPVINGAIS